ncbi:MAG: elongation factor Ts [Bacteroidia bacterium]|nr:elongation factor Ts [Bacteroidia bacterium]NNC85767.1 elongation factor Ts [Bacteroidia bacterium]NNM15705.1 elongation factor Ts [Bacteroidia bacterium]
MTTVAISAADVNKLRKQTGAGMMDCKKALVEASGDFEKAIDYLRKKGQKVASNRADRAASEGMVLASVTTDGKHGAMIALNCETDFVAKNDDFVQFGTSILNAAVENKPADLNQLLDLSLDGASIKDKVVDMMGKIGEKLEVSVYENLCGEKVVAYNHPGNKLASLVVLSSNEPSEIDEIGKNVAMQIAAMNPVAVDKDQVDQDTINREIEIGKDQARQEGKPEEMLEKIATGKLNKFFKESTLLNQGFIKEDKKTVKQYLDDCHKGLTVNSFKRIQLGA